MSRASNYELLKELLERGEADAVLFCQGREPEQGLDATFEPLVSQQVFSGPKVDENDKVDYFDLQDFTIVTEGAQLMRRVAATTGVSGFDILGAPITAKPGEDSSFMDLPGTAISPDDPNLLIATKKGHPILHDKGVEG